ncbi:hypothetical protein PHLGIDRAFT_414044 [Phlebiopsis gigantea 11061_1 CR5-6]|uniref:Secreted protein n=1 Tax=Phlebiopsis gigantea (strain 11061_1 CR5-6) TaxID=745531 RepID=A0A0C3RZ28_PHLG1|nr:hypothetical protein PHLGIDRAFT_414044 [Phlebiopsis gigantea 11061_1 CR5-6]
MKLSSILAVILMSLIQSRALKMIACKKQLTCLHVPSNIMASSMLSIVNIIPKGFSKETRNSHRRGYIRLLNDFQGRRPGTLQLQVRGVSTPPR